MAGLNKANLLADITNNIYTNTQKLIKGNLLKSRLVNIIDSTLNKIDDKDANGGYLGINNNGLVDISKIQSIAPQGYYLRDDGTWQPVTSFTTPTLQEVTDSGNTTTNAISVIRGSDDGGYVLLGVDGFNKVYHINGPDNAGYSVWFDDNDQSSITIDGLNGITNYKGNYTSSIDVLSELVVKNGIAQLTFDNNGIITTPIDTTVSHTTLINLNAQSVKKNGNEIETQNNKGVANGYAPLDSNNLIPSLHLPSFVDDVLEFANLASFPVTGENGKIYIDLSTNLTYRWGGSVYVEITDKTATWGQIDGLLSNQIDLQNALNAKENLSNKATTIIGNETNNTLYLSAKAVFDAINNTIRIISRVTTPQSHTGNTTLTILNSVSITGGTFTVGDIVKIEGFFNKLTPANTTSIVRLYYNTINSLTGATLIGGYLTTTGNAQNVYLTRHLFIKTTTNTEVANASASMLNDTSIFANNTLPTSLNINWANNGFIIAACLLNNAADVVQNNSLTVFKK